MSRGRPFGTRVKFTKKAADTILDHVRKGGFPAHAAAKAHIHRDTILEWCKCGKQEGAGDLYEFAMAYAEAKAEGCEPHIQAIRDARHGAGERDWKAHALLLSKLDPATFGIAADERRHLQLQNEKLRAEIEALRKGQLPGGGTNLTREEFAGLFTQRFGQPPGRAKVEQIDPPDPPNPNRNARGEHDAE